MKQFFLFQGLRRTLLLLALLAASWAIPLRGQVIYKSGNTTQFSPQSTGQGIVYQQVITVYIDAEGTGTPADVLTNLKFNIRGTTNPGDISNARLFRSSYNNNSLTTMLAGPIATPTVVDGEFDVPLSYTFTGSNNGDNYFFLTFDISPAAAVGNKIDAECVSFTLNGSTVLTPTTTAPSGALTVLNPMKGTRTIDASLPAGNGNFTTLKAAVDSLNLCGPGEGGITFLITDGQNFANQTSTVIIKVSGTADRPIVFKQSGTGAKPIYNTTANPSIEFDRADYITLDGLDIRNPNNDGFKLVSFQADGCQHNTIKNCDFTLKTDLSKSCFLLQTNGKSAATGANSYNTFENITITNANYGFQINWNASLGSYPDEDVVIRNVDMTNVKTSFIYARDMKNLHISGSEFSNLSGTGNTTGLDLQYMDGECHFYNNSLHDMSSSGATSYSRALYVNRGVYYIYNNVFYNLSATASNNSNTFNAIRIDGNTTTAYVYHTTALLNYTCADGGSSSVVNVGNAKDYEFINNVFVNLCTVSGVGKAAVFNSLTPSKLLAGSDNNLYYAGEPSATHLINIGTDYQTLANYKAAVGSKEAASITENPPFVSATDLHIRSDFGTGIEQGGKPVTLVTTDFDGDARSATAPDLGADEGTFKPFNKKPTIDAVSDQEPIDNNEPEKSIQLSGLSDGNPENTQNLSFTATSSNTALIPNPTVDYTQGNSTATLRFTPSGTGKGDVTIKVRLTDDGGTDNGGVDSAIITFVVPVLDPNVNNQPAINALTDVVCFNNSGLQTINLSGIGDGDPKKTQNITVTASADPSGIVSGLTVNYTPNQPTGSLTFSPAGLGTTTITVTVQDDGGTANGGVDTRTVTFDVTVKDIALSSYTDDFNDGTHAWWVSKVGEYSLSEAGGNLRIKGGKKEKWVSFGCNLPSAIDITDHPYLYLRARCEDQAKPYLLKAYIHNGTTNINVDGRVLATDTNYTDICFDFSGKSFNYTTVNQVFFAINGAALTWSGLALFDHLILGAEAPKMANMCAFPNYACAPGSGQQKIYVTDMSNVASLELSGGSSLIENHSFSAISGGMSTLTLTPKTGITGSELITITAKGANGFADHVETFWFILEGNLKPTIAGPANLDVAAGEKIKVALTNISDGNTTMEQELSFNVLSSHPAVITQSKVNYTQGHQTAELEFVPVGNMKNVLVKVAITDEGTGDNTDTLEIMVNSYADYNRMPTVSRIDNQDLLLSAGAKTVLISGIGDGDGNGQNLTITVESSVDTVIANPVTDIVYVQGQETAQLILDPSDVGVTTITVTITDNGGTAENNGNASVSTTFEVSVLNDPVYGYVAPLETLTQDLAAGVWSPQAGKYTVTQTDFDGYNNVMKVDMTNKSNWDGIWYNMPELNLKDQPYMSMDVYPVTHDLYWHVYFYDVNGQRNATGTHAERKYLTKGQWNHVVLDYRADGYLLDNDGNPINTERITDLLFNMHDKDFPFPFTTVTGSFYLKDIRLGTETIFPVSNPSATLNPVLDQSHLAVAEPEEIKVVLTGISNGNYSVEGVTVTATTDNAAVANPAVGTVKGSGTADLTYTPGTPGTAKIVVTVSAEGATAVKDSFLVSVLSTNPAEAAIVTVDTTTKYQLIHGFGSYMNEMRYADVYALDLGASAMRIGLISNQIEPVNDNNDPNVLDMSQLNRSVFNWDYFRKLKENGVEHFILTSWSPPAWMKGNLSLDYMSGGVSTSNDATDNKLQYHYYDEFAESMVAVCRMFKEEVGMDIYGIGLQNEPAFHEPYPSAIMDPSHFVQIIKVVGARFEAEGIPTKLYMPEQVFSQGANSMAQYIDAVQADPLANQYCEIIATHAYAADGIAPGEPDFSQWTAMWNNAQEGAYPKEMWMTETFKKYTNWKDALSFAGALHGSLTAGNISNWTSWSFVDAYVDQFGVPTSMFYTMKNYYKYIRPGARRVACTASPSDILESAWVNDADEKHSVVLVLINKGTAPFTYLVQGSNLPSQFEAFLTKEDKNFESIGEFASDEVILLPPSSVMTLRGTYGNHAPKLDPVANKQIMVTDPTSQQITLNGISDGEVSGSQTLTFTASSSNPAVIPSANVSYTQGEASAILNYSHAGQTGKSTITLVLRDNGGTDGGAVDSVKITFEIGVYEINNKPVIAATADASILEDAVAQQISLSGIDDGDVNVSQTLAVTATADKPELFTAFALNYTPSQSSGTINYTPAPNAFGVAKVVIEVRDFGGHDFNNGNQSVTDTFLITINAVNDAPTLNSRADTTMSYLSQVRTIPLTGFGKGAANESQSVLISVTTDNPSIFTAITPKYNQSSSNVSLEFSQAGNGEANVRVRAKDNGGILNGGIDTVVVTFKVTLNGMPLAVDQVAGSELAIFPNPASDKVYLRNAPVGAIVSLHDAWGREISTTKAIADQVEIDVQGLAPGIYTIRLSDARKQPVSRLFMKE